MGAGIQPRKASPKHLHIEIAALQVGSVYIGNFQLTTMRGLQTSGDTDHIIVVEVKPRHCDIRLWLSWLLLDRDGSTTSIEFDYAIVFRRLNHITKHSGASCSRRRLCQQFGQAMTVKDVVAEN